MDPSEDFPPPPALFPPPAPAAAAPPPASTAASLVGPRIFILSPLPGNKYEVDWYFYSARADVTTGDYAALLAFATHYAYPLAILQCPDLAAFQASNPAAVVRPFDEVPAPIFEWGRALMLSSAASVASPSGGSASSQSLLSLSTSLPSAGTNAHESSSVRGHDPPLVAASTRTSSLPVSHTFAPPFPPRRPDPDGVDGPSFVFGMGSSGGFGRLGGPPGGLGGMGYRRASARLTPVSGFSDYSSNNDDFRIQLPSPNPGNDSSCRIPPSRGSSTSWCFCSFSNYGISSWPCICGEWSSPFEWLSSYSTKGLKTRWDQAIAGTGICPICHRAEKPWHVPANCPLLKELNLTLVKGPPSSSPAPAPSACCPLPVLSSRLSYLYFFLNGFCWVHPTVGCRILLFFVDDTFGFSSLYFNGPSVYPLPAI
jgi:hypothetical protein